MIPDIKQKKPKKITEYNFKTDFEILGKILASTNKRKILFKTNIPKTPKELSKETNLNFPTTSKTIKELENLKLIIIHNKDLRKGKIITITKKGIEVINDLNKKYNFK